MGPLEFQPSELAKILTIISLASFYAALRAGDTPPASLAEGLAVVRSCVRVIAAQPTLEQMEAPWVPATASS